IPSDAKYQTLVQQIGDRFRAGRAAAATSVNRELLLTYWEIGRYIVEYLQDGKERAKYGKQLLRLLSKDLSDTIGKGFSSDNLEKMRRFYQYYPISETLSRKLSWSHYFELLKIENDNKRAFYEKQCANERWSVRQLKRQKTSGLYERLARSKNKDELLELANKGQTVARPEDLIREPYVLDFLNLPTAGRTKESDLEQRLIDHLQLFMLELGKGYAFVGRQYRITIGDDHYYVDLVFYHFILKCFVLIDLKTRKANAGDVGQMNMYLSYFASEESREDDNPPVGIVLAPKQNEQTIQFALQGIPNQLLVSRYQTYLPLEEELRKEMERVMKEEE
ncbi:MAG: PDDEXK nuclease domain-containing protein, partial [Bacteroidota bacterium]